MADRHKALNMWRDGASAWDICEACGYSEPHVVYNLVFMARKGGDKRATRRGPGRGPAPSRRLEIAKLVRLNVSRAAIAERFGVTQNTVNVLIHRSRKYGELPPLEKAA